MNVPENLPRVGNHVSYFTIGTGDTPDYWEPLGKVMGFGTSNGEPVAIVNLDNAAYTEGRDYFITNLVVHLTSLRLTSQCEAL